MSDIVERLRPLAAFDAYYAEALAEIVRLRDVADRKEDALQQIEYEIERLRSPDCPVCGGDCAGANPPVMNCPMLEKHQQLERLRECERLQSHLIKANAEIERLRGELRLKQIEADGAGSLLLDVQQDCIEARKEIERLRAVLLNVQALAERGYPIDNAKLATRCRLALHQQTMTEQRCQKCGRPLNGEVALVSGQEWCHPCADEIDPDQRAER